MDFFKTVLFHVIRFLIRIPAFFVYPVKIIHKKRLPKKAKYVTVSNHLSWVDVVYVHFRMRGRRYIIGKKEIADRNGFARVMGKAAGIIYIDRENPSVGSVKQILTHLKHDHPISIFPEGTRNRESRELMALKPGAAVFAVKGKAPIIPVMVHHKARAFHKNYVYIGEPFDLAEYEGMRFTEEISAAADEKIRAHMLTEMEKMDDYVLNKRWKKRVKDLTQP